MSGPKVIRIVTREEVIAICQGLLARLDAAIASWTRIGERNQTISAPDIEATAARRDALRALLAKDRFQELQAQVDKEIAYLKGDTQARLEKAASAAAEAARTTRRAANTARFVLEALDKSDAAVPADLRRRLHTAASGGKGGDSAINEAFGLLPAASVASGVTKEQTDLARALGAGGAPLALKEWLRSNNAAGDDEDMDRVENEIATLRMRAGPGVAEIFAGRVSALQSEPLPAKRHLLADSLLVDLAAAVKREEAQGVMVEELAALRAELGLLSSVAARDLCGMIDAGLAMPGVPDASSLVKSAADLLAAEMRERAVASRRLAVLQGLASLGYEVSEGMATAWVKNGKVILRRAASPGYGVEIASGAAAERLQVRAVNFGGSDDARDRDMETIWCGEFERLRQIVAKSGGEVYIEKATPVGVTPLKTARDPGPIIIDIRVTSKPSLQVR